MTRIGHPIDHGKRFEAAHRPRRFHQSRGRHQFDLAGELRPTDFEKAVRLIVGCFEKFMNQIQIHFIGTVGRAHS